MRGRKPKPTHLKVIQGNPGRRPLPKDEPQPRILEETPEPPAFFGEIAREEWYRLYPQLVEARLVTELDLDALQIYCSCYGHYRLAEKKLAEEGMTVLSASGRPMESPYVAIAHKNLVHMHRIMVEFGMTPSSRSRVGPAPGAKPKLATKGGNAFLDLARKSKREKGES